MSDEALPPKKDKNEVLQNTLSGSGDTNEKPAPAIPKKKKSTTTSVWSIKGIDNETRTKVSAAAKRSGDTIGAYVNRALLEVGPTQDELNATMMKNITDLSLKIEELGNAKPGMLKRLFGA